MATDAEIIDRATDGNPDGWDIHTLDVKSGSDTLSHIIELEKSYKPTRAEIRAAMDKGRIINVVADAAMQANTAVNVYPLYSTSGNIGAPKHADLNNDGTLLFAGDLTKYSASQFGLKYKTYSIDHEGNVQETGITHSMIYYIDPDLAFGNQKPHYFTSEKYMGAVVTQRTTLYSLRVYYLIINKDENTSMTGTIGISASSRFMTWNLDVAVPTSDHLAIIVDEQSAATVGAVLNLNDETVDIYNNMPLQYNSQQYRGMILVGNDKIVYATAATVSRHLTTNVSVKMLTLANQDITDIVDLTGNQYFDKAIWLGDGKFGLLNVTKFELDVYDTSGQRKDTIKFFPKFSADSIRSVTYNKSGETLSVVFPAQSAGGLDILAVLSLKKHTFVALMRAGVGMASAAPEWFTLAGENMVVQDMETGITPLVCTLHTYSGLCAVDKSNYFRAIPGAKYQGTAQEAVGYSEIVPVKITRKYS